MSTAEEYRARHAATEARFAHIGLPDGAITDSYWTPTGDGLFARTVAWWNRNGDVSSVSIYGDQYSDGRADMPIIVTLDNDDTLTVDTAAEAREVAALLLQAASVLDTLNGLS